MDEFIDVIVIIILVLVTTCVTLLHLQSKSMTHVSRNQCKYLLICAYSITYTFIFLSERWRINVQIGEDIKVRIHLALYTIYI